MTRTERETGRHDPEAGRLDERAEGARFWAQTAPAASSHASGVDERPRTARLGAGTASEAPSREQSKRRARRWSLPALGALLVGVALAAVCFGAAGIAPADALA
ncbi:MAG TPA: hypothetical protein VFM87_04860, partial [Agrococcus sp.]|nr:hypothetical protein [Agrococcus sp.]